MHMNRIKQPLGISTISIHTTWREPVIYLEQTLQVWVFFELHIYGCISYRANLISTNFMGSKNIYFFLTWHTRITWSRMLTYTMSSGFWTKWGFACTSRWYHVPFWNWKIRHHFHIELDLKIPYNSVIKYINVDNFTYHGCIRTSV